MALPPTIAYTTVRAYNLVWQDHGSGAVDDLGIWRPILPTGGFFLGDYGQGDYSDPALPVTVISGVQNDDPDSPALQPPSGYTSLWFYGSSKRVSGMQAYVVWTPIAPNNYVPCGSIATATTFHDNGSLIPPSNSDIAGLVCVRSDLAKSIPSSQVQRVWQDHGSGLARDLSIWRVFGLNTMLGSTDENLPPNAIYVPSNLPNQDARQLLSDQ